jgi:hypothetical protein
MPIKLSLKKLFRSLKIYKSGNRNTKINFAWKFNLVIRFEIIIIYFTYRTWGLLGGWKNHNWTQLILSQNIWWE